MTWFVARTKGRESRAAVDLQRHGVRAFWPRLHRYYVDKRTKEERFRLAALIPGYVFVELDTAKERDYVQSCYYLGGLLGEWTEAGFRPREIPTRYVVDLIEHGPLEVNKRHTRAPFKKGDRVKLSLSAVTSIIADVNGIDIDGKVVIKAELLGGARFIHVEPERLEAFAETASDTATIQRPSVSVSGG